MIVRQIVSPIYQFNFNFKINRVFNVNFMNFLGSTSTLFELFNETMTLDDENNMEDDDLAGLSAFPY